MEKKKIVKLIDILCLISLNEKLPEKIKYDNQIYNYCDVAKDYYYTYFGINIYLLKTLFSKPTTFLNDEIEILYEIEGFEDIKEIPIPEIESIDNARILNVEIKLNQLIRNQKKIIESLKEESE